VANSTLLSLFQQSLQSVGVVGSGMPASVVGNTNQDVVQTLAQVNIAANQIARVMQWEGGTAEYRFTTVYYQYTGTVTNGSTSITGLSSTTGLTTTPTLFQATATGINQDTYLVSVDAGTSSAVMSQAATSTSTGQITFGQTKYPFPSDFDRLIDRTNWDKSKHWEMLGPETAQQWQWLKSGYIATGPRIRFRPLGLYFQIWPIVTTADYLGFEYQSKFWILAASGAAVSKQYFTVDTDTCIFPDALMHALIRLKYFQVKGFDTTAMQLDYDTQLDLAKAHDQGSPNLSFAPRPGTVLITHDNIPDSGYGQ
jgi:hypothetical protein